MRLTYRRTIELHLGRQETKLWHSSDAYRDELQRTLKDMANDRGLPVELYLSNWGVSDGVKPLADSAQPRALYPRKHIEAAS